MNTASELVLRKDISTATILKSYKITLKKGPMPWESLNSDMFATLTPPSHELSDLNLGGIISLNVSAPAGTRPGWIVFGYNSASGSQVFFGSYETGSTSFTIDTTGKPAPSENAELIFSVTDAYDREFITDWGFFQ